MTPRQPHPPTPESAPQSAETETGEAQSASAANEKPQQAAEPASEDDDRVAAYMRGPTAFTA